MIELSNITFDEYICKEDRTIYDFAIKYAYCFREPKDLFNVGPFTKLPFGLIKDMQQDMSNDLYWLKDEQHEMGLVDYMVLITGREIKTFCKLSMLDIIQFKNFIVKEIEQISKVESIVLHYEPSDKEIAAGIEKLNVFGVYNQLLSVALGDPLKIEQVRKMKYEDAFVFLCNQKIKSDYEIRLMELNRKQE